MKLRHERLAEMIRTLASTEIVQYTQMRDHEFGVITIIDVQIDSDESYADLHVKSSDYEDKLAKYLAPLAQRIQREIGKQFGLRRTPKIRFRTGKNTKSPTDILSLIHTLDQQYGLSDSN